MANRGIPDSVFDERVTFMAEIIEVVPNLPNAVPGTFGPNYWAPYVGTPQLAGLTSGRSITGFFNEYNGGV